MKYDKWREHAWHTIRIVLYSYNLLHKFLYISTHLQAASSGIQPPQTLQDVGPPPLPGPGAEAPGPVDAGGADAALLPHGAGGTVQPALGQVMVDEAQDIGRFDGQGLLGRRRSGGGGACLAGAIVVGDDGGGPFFGHLRHGYYWLKNGAANAYDADDGDDGKTILRHTGGLFPPTADCSIRLFSELLTRRQHDAPRPEQKES